MRRQLHSELIKLGGGRTLLALTVAACLLDACSILGTPSRAAEDLVRLSFGSLLFSMLLGVLLVTREYRCGSVARTLLLGRRGDVVLAKALAAALAAALVIATCAIASGGLVADLAIHARTGHHIAADRGLVLTLIGVLAVNPAAAALGTFVGWIVRGQASALVFTLTWTL